VLQVASQVGEGLLGRRGAGLVEAGRFEETGSIDGYDGILGNAGSLGIARGDES